MTAPPPAARLRPSPAPEHDPDGWRPGRAGGPAAWALAVLRFGFLVWAAVVLARGRPGDAVALVVMFAVLHVPLALRLPLVFDAAFLAVWTLQALGQVAGFWSRVPWWDTLVHAALPAVLAPTALILLIRAGVLPDLPAARGARARLGLVMVVFLVAAGFGTLYEIYEWLADLHLGTHYQPDNADTMTDLSANDLGGLAGGLWLVIWAARHRR